MADKLPVGSKGEPLVCMVTTKVYQMSCSDCLHWSVTFAMVDIRDWFFLPWAFPSLFAAVSSCNTVISAGFQLGYWVNCSNRYAMLTLGKHQRTWNDHKKGIW